MTWQEFLKLEAEGKVKAITNVNTRIPKKGEPEPPTWYVVKTMEPVFIWEWE